MAAKEPGEDSDALISRLVSKIADLEERLYASELSSEGLGGGLMAGLGRVSDFLKRDIWPHMPPGLR
ncbi:hypothetical protein WJX72_000995 [[Myrmecia] bisecta]|uniref:Uncharacterized protein n=1 Tax=[Myrmecia] bisecta TaxID=41462 RepID=A0AAW1P7J5_9CHLO